MMLRPLHTKILAVREAVVTDGPILTKGAKEFRVSSISATYTWRHGAWTLKHIDLSGQRQRLNGEIGSTHTRTFFPTGNMPRWLLKISNQLKPSGSPYTDDSRFTITISVDTLEA